MNTPRQYDGDFCAFCGFVFDSTVAWPRTCPKCQGVTEQKHIPLISVIWQTPKGISTLTTMPRSKEDGIYLPSTFLDFGETWRQAAARCIEAVSSEVRFNSFDVDTLEGGITNIFALVEDGTEHVPISSCTKDTDQLTNPQQRRVVQAWLDNIR